MASPGNWLDGLIGWMAPAAGLRRARARAATQVVKRHYEAAASGRRTQGWRRTSGDVNSAVGPALGNLRNAARDLVRNNGYAESALTTICDHVVGWGVTPKATPKSTKVDELWKQWAGSLACDADGRHDFAGLQRLVMRTVVESGEALVRRRLRRPDDSLPIPLQLQVLDPDYLDTAKTGVRVAGGGQIINGVELDAIGRRVAYWLFPEHPGSATATGSASVRVPADGVLHVFRSDRPGQVRGASWFAPVLLKFKDFDDFDDATLMKQKVAACLAVVVSDPTGANVPIGTVSEEPIDSLEPGAILRGIPGTIDVVQPPSVREYPDYIRTTLRGIATGLGITYEDLTGDYSQVNFSSARMGRLKHWSRVEEWRWQMLIPLFCGPAWAWFAQAAGVLGVASAEPPGAEWTVTPMPMIEPDKEGLAYKRLIRAGLMTLPEALRERGYEPQTVLEEIAQTNKKLDELGLVLDSDPRKTSDAGLTQARPAGEPTETGGASTDDEEDGDMPARARRGLRLRA